MRFFLRTKMHIILAAVVIFSMSFAVFIAQQFKSQAAPLAPQNSWNVVSSPNISGGLSRFSDVAALSPTDVWAVGDTGTGPLIEHWDGARWTIFSISNNGILSGVAAVSSSDAWAVGTFNGAQTVTEHWDGTGWTVWPSPDPGAFANSFSSVAAASSSDIWAVGSESDAVGSSHTLVEHWDGSHWTVGQSASPGLADNVLNGLAVISSSNVWGVGYSTNTSGGVPQPLIEHYTGTTWSTVASPPLGGGGFLVAVAALSSSNIWAVGSSNNASQALIEHWNGSQWSLSANAAVGAGDALTAVAAISASDVWAIGTYFTESGYDQTLTEHWDGTRWRVVSSPNVGGTCGSDFFGASATSTNDVWAVGFSSSNCGGFNQPLVEHFGPLPKQQILFVLLQGIDSNLTSQQAGAEGGLGKIPAFNTTQNGVTGIQPFLKSQYPQAKFLAFSYNGSDLSNGDPFPYTCLHTLEHSLADDALALSLQITDYVKAQPKNTVTDVYLIGHSLGGVVALSYLTALLEAPTKVIALPTNGHLAGVITLDSPVGGVSSNPDFLNETFHVFQAQCSLLLNQQTQFTSVLDLAKLYDTTSQPTFPATDDGNNGSQGAHASILSAVFQGNALTNQGLVEEAAINGIGVLTIGNMGDFLYNPSACPLGPSGVVPFTDAQWIGDEGPADAAQEGHFPLAVYGRYFTTPGSCTLFNLFNLNHFQVLNNTAVETGLGLFLPDGSDPTPLICATPGLDCLAVAPPEP